MTGAGGNRISWRRSVAVAVAGALVLTVAAAVAAVATLEMSGFTFVCGDGGQPNGCQQGASSTSIYAFLALAAAGVCAAVACVVGIGLGRHAAEVGRLRIVALSALLIAAVTGGFLLGVWADDAAQLSGRLSWQVPVAATLAPCLLWLIALRRVVARRPIADQ